MCAIDWSRLAHYEYQIAAKINTYDVGDYIAKVFKGWNLTLDSVTLVGHSLGAQVAGQVGKQCNGKLGKIFGKLGFRV